MAPSPGQPAENQGGGTISLQFSQAIVPRDAGSLIDCGFGIFDCGFGAGSRAFALFFPVHVVLVEGLGFADRKGPGLSVEFLEKTAAVAGVAGAPILFDLEEKHVAIAIDEPSHDALGVAAAFAFEPKLVARAAPVVHEAGFERFFQSFAIHPGKHENTPRRGVFIGSLLDDRRDEMVGCKFEVEFHGCRMSAIAIIRILA